MPITLLSLPLLMPSSLFEISSTQLAKQDQLTDNTALWLETHNLTKQLKKTCSDYRFQVCSESFSPALAHEAKALKIPENSDIWLRCSAHFDQGNPLIHCRVAFPKTTFDAFEAILRGLGDKQIGDHLLYNQADVTRTPFLYAYSNKLVEASNFLLADEQPLWCRYSLFKWGEHSLMITEVFTDKLPNHSG